VPIVAVVLLLGSDHGTTKGLAFVLAWCAGLAAVGAIVLLLAGILDANDAGEPAMWVNVLLLVLGLLLLLLALRQWRGRPRGDEETPMPTWMRRIDGSTPVKAAGAGLALTALNPKNVLLIAVGAAEIADVGIPPVQEIAVLVAFVLIASAGVLTPLIVALAFGASSRGLLDAIKDWMARYNAAIMTVLFLLIGAKPIDDAIAGFSG
jgi:threonine/homoserine/homoserine lactone efflux protein